MGVFLKRETIRSHYWNRKPSSWVYKQPATCFGCGIPRILQSHKIMATILWFSSWMLLNVWEIFHSYSSYWRWDGRWYSEVDSATRSFLPLCSTQLLLGREPINYDKACQCSRLFQKTTSLETSKNYKGCHFHYQKTRATIFVDWLVMCHLRFQRG